MISYVADFLNSIVLIIQRFLHAASFAGQIITIIVTGIFSTVFQIVRSLFLFLQIVYEDNLSVFTEDLPSLFNNLVNSTGNHLSCTQDFLVSVYFNIFYKVSAILESFNWAIVAVLLVICEVFTIMKNAVIFIGDTLWILLTFIPVQLPQLLRSLLNYLIDISLDTVINSYKTLLEITNYLTDVPLQSFAGIISTIVFVRLSVYFREDLERQCTILYWAVRRKFWYLYHLIYNYFINSDVRMITQMAPSEEMVDRVGNIGSGIDESDDPTEALCIICQERQKCVLTLPCRHICLCIECCMRLYGYQRTCPICRTFIYHSVTVYL